jgi:hypothetical protein
VVFENLLRLWNAQNHHSFLHPDHETCSKKQAKALRKRLRAVKTEAAKDRYRVQIQQLMDEHKVFMKDRLITKTELEKYIETTDTD